MFRVKLINFNDVQNNEGNLFNNISSSYGMYTTSDSNAPLVTTSDSDAPLVTTSDSDASLVTTSDSEGMLVTTSDSDASLVTARVPDWLIPKSAKYILNVRSSCCTGVHVLSFAEINKIPPYIDHGVY